MLSQALRSLGEYRLAALLSGFGVAIGIASSIVLLSLVSGFERQLARQLRFDGSRSLILRTERPLPQIWWWELFRGVSRDEFLRDVAVIDAMSVESELGTRSVLRRATSGRYPVRAVEPDSRFVRSIVLVEGRFVEQRDQATEASVAVLGASARLAICGRSQCLGEQISIDGWQYRVIGSTDWIGEEAGVGRSARDREMYIPFNTAVRQFQGARVSPSVLLGVRNGQSEEQAERALRIHLVKRGLASADFEIRSGTDRQRSAARLFLALRALGVLVGSVTLAVGVVGVMNVMLLNVKSRTAEIGIRRALGATKSKIFGQFLIEALIITGINGVAGFGVGLVVCRIIALTSVGNIPEPIVSLPTAIFSVILISIAGVLAGVGPARRAAAVYPAVALRAE